MLLLLFYYLLVLFVEVHVTLWTAVTLYRTNPNVRFSLLRYDCLTYRDPFGGAEQLSRLCKFRKRPRKSGGFPPVTHRVADSFLIRARPLSSYCEVGV